MRHHPRARLGLLRLAGALLAALVLFLPSLCAQQPKKMTVPGVVYAASDGQGRVQLLWLAHADQWPHAWRLEEAPSGRVLVERIQPGGALEGLTPQERQSVQRISEALAPATPPQQRKNQLGFVVVRALADWNYARAAGLAWTLENVPAGARRYRVVGLDAAGQPTKLALQTDAVNSAVATPLPPAPTGLRGEAVEQGAALYWAPVAATPKLPVLSYYVERQAGGQSAAVTPKPLVLGVRWDPKAPALVDAEAPVEQEVTYQVSSVDLFGRRSAPSTAAVFIPDAQAVAPPASVSAATSDKGVTVKWTPGANPHTAGYIVERAYLLNGPYEALTAQALPAKPAEYTDAAVTGGTAYYYRVRAVGPRGDVGSPSLAAKAQPRNPQAPPRPQGLKAETGSTRVRLTWEAVPFPVAGYFVERRADNKDNWVRLNDSANPEPLYDDRFSAEASGGFQYRVVAVAFDNQESDASEAVAITLTGSSPPPSPGITSLEGRGGKVTLEFEPGLPAEASSHFLVLRAGSPNELGLVIGDPLPGQARRFEDTHVAAGYDYWYRVVAVNVTGDRSEPSSAVVVRVGSPALPAPARLTVEFLATPFPRVVIRFSAPPAGLMVVVQRRSETDPTWLSISGPSSGPEVLDANPPAKGKILYRIVYQAANEMQGPPSEAVEVQRP